jgi:hypothetical protein
LSSMHPDVQRYLDGLIGREQLSPEQQREADRFDSWSRSLAMLPRDHAPAWLEKRIMVSLPMQPAAPLLTRVTSWALEAHRIRIRPITVGLAAAALAGLMVVWPGPRVSDRGGSQAALPTGDVVQVSNAAPIYVQFVLVDRDANSVAVAGDFNNWQRDGVALRDSDGDGVWTGLVALPPGLHKYMFIVDGERWVTDPEAERHVDDGFGMRNAVITVTPPSARAL